MGVDVLNVVDRAPGVGDRVAQRAGRVLARWIRLGNVVGVRRQAVARHLGQDRGASAQGVLELFEHQNRRALAQHDAVARCVERAARALGIVVARRAGTDAVEAADADGRQAALRAASQHRVGHPRADVHHRVANRHRRRCAGSARGGQWSARAELHRHVASSHIRDDPWRPKGREALDATFKIVLVSGLLHVHPTDATGNRCADAVALGRDVEPRSLNGLARRTHSKVDVAARASRGLAFHHGLGIEALDLAADLDWTVRDIERRDRPATRLADAQGGVELRDAVANRVDCPHAGNDHASHRATSLARRRPTRSRPSRRPRRRTTKSARYWQCPRAHLGDQAVSARAECRGSHR